MGQSFFFTTNTNFLATFTLFFTTKSRKKIRSLKIVQHNIFFSYSTRFYLHAVPYSSSPISLDRIVNLLASISLQSEIKLKSGVSRIHLGIFPSFHTFFNVLVSSPLFPLTMKSHQRREGSKGHWWLEMPNSNRPSTSYSVSDGIPSATTENITNRLTSLCVAEKGEQSDVSEPSIQFGNIGLKSHVSLHEEKCKLNLKASETVSGATTKVNKGPVDSTTVLADETRTSTEKPVTGLSSLLDNFTADDLTYSVAEIRAAFYPKFENENSDQEIRTRMIKIVSKGLATLEVSLKHSGSLFMYAGHEGGAYSKNSYGNIYTAVGVFVLGHVFREAWGSQANMKQAEFNEFLECNRMCISMELVTAVLGDHGQRPREDYVVVTAVTELGSGRPKFYETPDIIAFCRKWRLPTNHIWLFSTRRSVMSFFAAYDALCEEGTATPVCKTLDDIADISVPGSKNHVKVQGEILEGLVARIVSHESSKHMEHVLRDYPPPSSNGGDQHLGSCLREICAANRNDERQLIKALIDGVGPSFCPNSLDWFGHEASHSHSRNVGESVLDQFLSSRHADFSTEKLKEMFVIMKKSAVDFKCYHNFHKVNSVSSNNLHFKMVIHVRCDSAFRFYQEKMRCETGLWPLYRGFFVDLNLFKVDKERLAEFSKENNAMVEIGGDTNGASTKYGLADEDACLMIKLKFLTYKIRTFLLRNGLSTLFKKGPAAYKDYYLSQMKIWNTSHEKQKELRIMLDEWAESMQVKFGDRQLPSSTYLSEAEPFLEQYAKRNPLNQPLIGSAGSLVRTEDFLATVEGSEDVEGDLEPEREITSSSPAHLDNEAVKKDESLIVFFPGIPGCAKSALCEEILSTPGGLGDDRPVCSLMGDRIKGSRYWVKASEELCKRPCSILLADKNAPTEEVWRQIEDMCRSTKAYAVPVIPDSEGTESNPFSLEALAVFMLRVLNRVNHPGKLDKSSPNAGYVLLKFYHLYDGKSRREFESKLIERFGSLVKMPLLEPERSSIPESVRSILEEGISLYKLHTNRHERLVSKRKYANEWVKWEKQLQETLLGNAVYLNSIQVPFEFAVAKVLEQLKAIAKGQYAAPSTEKRRFGTIVFAAVSLPVSGILDLLENQQLIIGKDPKIEELLENMNLKSSLTKAHVTLAHKRSHGVTAVASYGPYLNQNVPVDITALFFSDQSAALEAEPGIVDGEKISSKNEWPHVTVWTAEGVAGKKANLLPHLFKQGKATRIDIKPPIRITGTLEFF
ncbi:tRNA ligase 1-like isoform X5 [Primulina eburnea]|uniref:tRNA ligase 1-like isoform X5 n=1 Tax=Primulina eburnea TaxID=1245227 RepID=UPI003C6C998B